MYIIPSPPSSSSPRYLHGSTPGLAHVARHRSQGALTRIHSCRPFWATQIAHPDLLDLKEEALLLRAFPGLATSWMARKSFKRRDGIRVAARVGGLSTDGYARTCPSLPHADQICRLLSDARVVSGAAVEACAV